MVFSPPAWSCSRQRKQNGHRGTAEFAEKNAAWVFPLDKIPLQLHLPPPPSLLCPCLGGSALCSAPTWSTQLPVVGQRGHWGVPEGQGEAGAPRVLGAGPVLSSARAWAWQSSYLVIAHTANNVGKKYLATEANKGTKNV